MMEISESMVKYYLDFVTFNYFNHHDVPPEDVTGYYEYVLNMKQWAISRGDLKALKMAFAYLLANPRINCARFGGGSYPYDDKEVREIIYYTWKIIWPDEPPVPRESLPDVELVQMSLEDWWARHES